MHGLVVDEQTHYPLTLIAVPFVLLVGFLIAGEAGEQLLPATTLIGIAGALIGLAMQLLVMHPLRRSSQLVRIIATIGVLTMLQAVRNLPALGVPLADALSAADLLPGPPAIPSAYLAPPDGQGSGLLAEYWANPRFEGEPMLTRTDPQVAINLGFFNIPHFNAISPRLFLPSSSYVSPGFTIVPQAPQSGASRASSCRRRSRSPACATRPRLSSPDPPGSSRRCTISAIVDVRTLDLALLQAAVLEHGADLGLAHDGDADRCLAVDHEGNDVDGDQIRPSYRLEAGDHVRGDIPPGDIAAPEGEDIPIDVRYSDDRVLVVSKPAGLVTHPARGHHTGTLVNALLGRYPSHRLLLTHMTPTGRRTGIEASGPQDPIVTGER